VGADAIEITFADTKLRLLLGDLYEVTSNESERISLRKGKTQIW